MKSSVTGAIAAASAFSAAFSFAAAAPRVTPPAPSAPVKPTLPPIQKPDYVVDSITPTVEWPGVIKKITITISDRCKGLSTDSPYVKVTGLKPGSYGAPSPLVAYNALALAKGAHVDTQTFTLVSPPPSDWTIRTTVNEDGKVLEVSTANNSRQINPEAFPNPSINCTTGGNQP